MGQGKGNVEICSTQKLAKNIPVWSYKTHFLIGKRFKVENNFWTKKKLQQFFSGLSVCQIKKWL